MINCYIFRIDDNEVECRGLDGVFRTLSCNDFDKLEKHAIVSFHANRR